MPPRKLSTKESAGMTHAYQMTIHTHAFDGDAAAVEQLLKEGVDVNLRSKEQWTPLHVAAARGHEDIADLLIKNGADVDALDLLRSTPLRHDVHHGRTDVAELLIHHGADVNARFITTLDAMSWAGSRFGMGYTTDLLSAYSKFIEGLHGSTLLHQSAGDGSKDIVEHLARFGAKIDETRETALYCAAENGHKDIAKLLIEHGAEVNVRNRVQASPLHTAAHFDNHTVVELLISQGADVNACTTGLQTPLLKAVRFGSRDTVGHLLVSGAEVNVCDRKGKSPLSLTAENKFHKKKLVEILLCCSVADFLV